MACKGLIVTKKVFEDNIAIGFLYNENTDPKGLVQTKASSWTNMDLLTKKAKAITDSSEDAAVAACRAWYDENSYGKPYCCQQFSMAMGINQVEVVDATETEAAESFTVNSIKYEFGAYAFDGAQALASGIAVVASALAFMN